MYSCYTNVHLLTYLLTSTGMHPELTSIQLTWTKQKINKDLKNSRLMGGHGAFWHSCQEVQGLPSWTHREWVDATDLCHLCDLMMMMMVGQLTEVWKLNNGTTMCYRNLWWTECGQNVAYDRDKRGLSNDFCYNLQRTNEHREV